MTRSIRLSVVANTAMVLAIIAPLACLEQTPRKKKGGPRILTPVDVSSLNFETPDLKKRFDIFNAAASDSFKDGFEHRPIGTVKGSNSIFATWAKGIDLDAERPAVQAEDGAAAPVHRIRVQALAVPPPSDVRAVGFEVEIVAPQADQWSVFLYYLEGTNQNHSRPGWSAIFYQWHPAALGRDRMQDRAARKLNLPVAHYVVGENVVELPPAGSVSDHLVRYARSADSLRDETLADISRLQELVIAFITEHRAMKMVYGKSTKTSGCAPPPHHLAPLDANEELNALATAKQHFKAQADMVREHHQEMYQALLQSFPLERCWPELKED